MDRRIEGVIFIPHDFLSHLPHSPDNNFLYQKLHLTLMWNSKSYFIETLICRDLEF